MPKVTHNTGGPLVCKADNETWFLCDVVPENAVSVYPSRRHVGIAYNENVTVKDKDLTTVLMTPDTARAFIKQLCLMLTKNENFYEGASLTDAFITALSKLDEIDGLTLEDAVTKVARLKAEIKKQHKLIT